MFNIGPKEIIIIAVVVVLLFGGKKIPELTKGIAESIRHLRGAFDSDTAEAKTDDSKKKK